MEKLYRALMEAYSDENLNRITGKLIDLYKHKNFTQIRSIATRVSKYVQIEEDQDVKFFSRLIMLYHPDRGQYYRNSIEESYAVRDEERLEQHAHILQAGEIEDI